jgi:radical SAM superfamily enzyme YgiQ (UPF0313 family)
MEKILFITPPNIKYGAFVDPSQNVKTNQKKLRRFGSVITDMPLGIISLSAYVKKFTKTQTKHIDFNIELNKLHNFEYSSFEDFFYQCLKSWADYAPTIIGISVLFTPSYQSMLEIAQCCREIYPKAMIVAGGGVPTNMYREIFRDSDYFDALCYGEGEKPLLGMVEAVDKFRYVKENAAWITPEKVESGQEFLHDFIENLDEIPFFDYDILDIAAYKLNPTISAYLSVDRQKLNFPVMTSRGCPHRCCFCSAFTVRGRKMRYHSINRVKEDFKRLKEQYGAKTIIFLDDHLMADKQRVFEIIGILKEFQMTAFFPNSLALYALERKVLEALKSVGVDQLVLSIESGSNRVLREIMHKPLNLSIVKRVADDCRELGIYTDVNILIGFPGETKQDIEDTKLFLRTIYANWFRINIATPLMGSEMLDICLKNNYIKGNYLDCDYKKAIVETEEFTVKYIQEKAYTLNLELNFVENSDYRLGDYETALNGFENAIRAKDDHALAYYYASKCLEKLDNPEKARKYMDRAKAIISEKPFWRKYVEMFNIPIENLV